MVLDDRWCKEVTNMTKYESDLVNHGWEMTRHKCGTSFSKAHEPEIEKAMKEASKKSKGILTKGISGFIANVFVAWM